MIALTSMVARVTIHIAPSHIVGLDPAGRGTRVVTVTENWSPIVSETVEQILAMTEMIGLPNYLGGPK